jgi:hypoxanthine-DNA glycosylase
MARREPSPRIELRKADAAGTLGVVTPVCSFPPISDKAARILILGSMPGEASLRARQYYAHPRNAFWPIVSDLLAFPVSAPYDDRLRHLCARGVALWDVLGSCVRNGSLDASIDESSIVPNDFASFLSGHPRVRYVFFNGSKAEQAFLRHVVPTLDPVRAGELACRRLPSTSPAHASLSFGQKLEAWRVLVNDADEAC